VDSGSLVDSGLWTDRAEVEGLCMKHMGGQLAQVPQQWLTGLLLTGQLLTRKMKMRTVAHQIVFRCT